MFDGMINIANSEDSDSNNVDIDVLASSLRKIYCPNAIDKERKKLRKEFYNKVLFLYFEDVKRKSFQSWRNYVNIKIVKKNNKAISHQYYTKKVYRAYFQILRINSRAKYWLLFLKKRVFNEWKSESRVAKLQKIHNFRYLKKVLKIWKLLQNEIMKIKKAYGFHNRILLKKSIIGLKLKRIFLFKTGKVILTRHKKRSLLKHMMIWRKEYKLSNSLQEFYSKKIKQFIYERIPLYLQNWYNYTQFKKQTAARALDTMQKRRKLLYFNEFKTICGKLHTVYQDSAFYFRKRRLSRRFFRVLKKHVAEVRQKRNDELIAKYFKLWKRMKRIHLYIKRRKEFRRFVLLLKGFNSLKTHRLQTKLNCKKAQFMNYLLEQKYTDTSFKCWGDIHFVQQKLCDHIDSTQEKLIDKISKAISAK